MFKTKINKYSIILGLLLEGNCNIFKLIGVTKDRHYFLRINASGNLLWLYYIDMPVFYVYIKPDKFKGGYEQFISDDLGEFLLKHCKNNII